MSLTSHSKLTPLLTYFLKHALCQNHAHTHTQTHITQSGITGLVPSLLCPRGETNDGVETKTAKSTIRREDGKSMGGGNITHFVMTQNNRRGEEKTYKT